MYGLCGGWSPRGSAQACALVYAKFRLTKYEKSKKHKKHYSQVPSAHSILTPSSSTSVATPLPSSPTPLSSIPPSSSVPVTSAANLAGRSPPVPLPIALRLSLSTLRARASHAISKDFRMTSQMARLQRMTTFTRLSRTNSAGNQRR
ncbi:hypothetical protein PI125_g6863 [Phytophthora idaei]|nr:hypothetical protein PI125_g6863 [Phytophthora idaei]